MKFSLNWGDLFGVPNLGDTGIRLSRLSGDAFRGAHGTTIRIGSLRSAWDQNKIEDLGANLARLVSPFGAEDFTIRIEAPGQGGTADVRNVQPPRYMSEPKYRIAGRVDADGTIHWRYRYRPIGRKDGREDERVDERSGDRPPEAECGPFDFEIRAWDLSPEDTRDIAEHYRETRSRIRGLSPHCPVGLLPNCLTAAGALATTPLPCSPQP